MLKKRLMQASVEETAPRVQDESVLIGIPGDGRRPDSARGRSGKVDELLRQLGG
jgi:hypothetical protein